MVAAGTECWEKGIGRRDRIRSKEDNIGPGALNALKTQQLCFQKDAPSSTRSVCDTVVLLTCSPSSQSWPGLQTGTAFPGSWWPSSISASESNRTRVHQSRSFDSGYCNLILMKIRMVPRKTGLEVASSVITLIRTQMPRAEMDS